MARMVSTILRDLQQALLLSNSIVCETLSAQRRRYYKGNERT
jgi:hypothetical protein